MLKLNNRVEIIIPQQDNNGVEIESPTINDELSNITRACGGCTVTEVGGQWFSEEEERIMEDNNLNYEWYYDKDMDEKQEVAYDLYIVISYLIGHYDQEAVSIKIDGSLYIIDENDLNFLSYELYKLMF
ncbi:hypothetical protein HOS99_gp124 [Staphylococcus phage phiSA_BS1]|uniref:Uncharacterized protein n=2 Tax=Baoshanvirus TaxID=2732969 RepID=A0A2P1MXU0_9CAUD|nr:hypothetical protein HOS99_gp124 [Staphylococcus phage phiSA_BS1]YP_009800049.1 hypothetical protein HOT02_gp209 [Staphylococcus phage phiSA_BS2]AVP40365.1 hypothetical protein [Staphylococcus phage phiSA_BS1]AVR55653.1 hypothetical protein phiSABS2_209 [Staphylococcus phage phiSA_BS2]